MKTCTKCGGEGPFWKDKTKKDGFHSLCVDCKSETDKKYRQSEKGREVGYASVKKWQSTTSGRKKSNGYKKNWALSNQEKCKASSDVRHAVESGRLTKPDRCSIDGCTAKKNIQGHHEDYSKPLDVVWLCAKHHKLLHKVKAINDVIDSPNK